MKNVVAAAILISLLCLCTLVTAAQGVVPSNGVKYKPGTRFQGKCEAAKTAPTLKHQGFDDNGVPKGDIVRHHLDWTVTGFYKLGESGGMDGVGGVEPKDSDEKGNPYVVNGVITERCGQTTGRGGMALVLDSPGHYRMVVTRTQRDLIWDPKTMIIDGYAVVDGSEKKDEKTVDFEIYQTCDGDRAKIVRVSNATTGQPLSPSEREMAGIADDRFYEGQTVTASGASSIEVETADGSMYRFSKGSSAEFNLCPDDDSGGITVPTAKVIAGEIWFHILHALGQEDTVQVETQDGATGVRGTIFTMAYDVSKRLSTLHVIQGSVELHNKTGPKGSLLVKTGQTATQQGSSPPALVK